MPLSASVTLPVGAANPFMPVMFAVIVTGVLHSGPNVPVLWPLPKVRAIVGEASTVSAVACAGQQGNMIWPSDHMHGSSQVMGVGSWLLHYDFSSPARLCMHGSLSLRSYRGPSLTTDTPTGDAAPLTVAVTVMLCAPGVVGATSW